MQRDIGLSIEMSSSINTQAPSASNVAPMAFPSEDRTKKDDDVSEDSTTPKLPYRISYEKHPYTIGLSMFDDDSESESDDDGDDDNDASENDEDVTIETIGLNRRQEQGTTILQQAQSVTFREATPPTSACSQTPKITKSSISVEPQH